MVPANAPTWQNPRILLTLLLVFLCGGTVGMAAMAFGLHRWIHPAAPAAATWRDTGKEVTYQRLKKELDLSSSQSEQLETILDDFFTYYHTLQAQLDEVRATGKQRIIRILNDQQRQKFDRIMSESKEKQLH